MFFQNVHKKLREAVWTVADLLFLKHNPLPLPVADEGFPPRILIASQPKAGTYLCAAILEEIGFDFTFLHLKPGKLQAYDKNLFELVNLDPALFTSYVSLSESRRIVRTGQVAVSHLAPVKKVIDLLEGFKIIALKRELRSGIVSNIRFILGKHEPNKKSEREKLMKYGAAGFLRSHGRFYIERTLAINEWGKEPNAILLRFEDLLSDPSAQILLMAQFLGKAPQDIPGDVYEKARKNNTLTKSDHRIKVEWDERAETEFRRLGGIEANSILGYG